MTETFVQTAGESQATNDNPSWGNHFGRVIGSRGFVWSLVVVGGGGFVAMAAMTGQPGQSFAVLGGAIALWLLVAALRARSLAETAFLLEYSRLRGFNYLGSMQLLETTPLLAAGDHRNCQHYMEGPLMPAEDPTLRFGLAHYTFDTYEEIQNRRGVMVEAATPHRMTICVVEVPEAAEIFNGIYVIRRRGVFKSVSGTTWLNFGELRQVELESEAFSRRYDLYVKESQSDHNIVRLFKPTFQLYLAELPTELYFEYHYGTLVVYRFKHEDEAVELDAQVHTTQRIAKELREALK